MYSLFDPFFFWILAVTFFFILDFPPVLLLFFLYILDFYALSYSTGERHEKKRGDASPLLTPDHILEKSLKYNEKNPNAKGDSPTECHAKAKTNQRIYSSHH